MSEYRPTTRIGYYAHHHGSGHLQRATALAACMSGDLTVLSSADPPAGVDHLRLDRDDTPPIGGDVTADGALHWVPLRHNGLRRRTLQVARWVDEQRCAVMVSDVSVEILLLSRLLSVPAVSIALRGRRTDPAHALGYDIASLVVAPWPEAMNDGALAGWTDKTLWTGALSRYERRPRLVETCQRSGRCVVVLVGTGGHTVTERSVREASLVADTHWHLLGSSFGPAVTLPNIDRCGWIADPWPELCRADVVVCVAGDAAIADVAAARKPLITIPAPRPFDEQRDHCDVLVRHGLCLSEPSWPDHHRWPRLLDQAEAVGGHGWAEYLDGSGSQRFAAAVRHLAGDGLAPAEDSVRGRTA